MSRFKSNDNSVLSTLSSDEYLQKPLIIETQITKDPPKTAVRLTKIKTAKTKVVQSYDLKDASGHRFPYGYCTYYVSSRRTIPWPGNAITWLSGARSYGFATGDTPQAGAIIVTSEGGWTGHVAMVDTVNGDSITISEMNYSGWGVISSRTISTSYRAILGYIY